MRPRPLVLLALLALLAALLAPPAAAAARPPDGACALLTAGEVAAVQGSEVVEAKPGRQVRDGLEAASCFFRTADYGRSASLEVTRRDPALAAGPGAAERWRTLFAGDPEEREHEAEEQSSRYRTGEGAAETEGAPAGDDGREEALAVEGLGDEACWIGTAVYGALYALQGDAYLRVSVGGPGDLDAKLDRARRLAAAALARLPAAE